MSSTQMMQWIDQIPKLPALAGTGVGGRELVDQHGGLTDLGLSIATALVFGTWCTLVYKLGRVVSPMLFKSYSKLSIADQRNWDTRYSSMLHSYVTVHVAVTELLLSDQFFKDGPVPHVLRTNRLTNLTLGMSLGYFVVDLACCYKYDMGGTPMLAHHVGSLASVVTAMLSGQCHMHALWMLVTELTTPFINFRWWFEKAGMKATKAYAVNGLLIVLMWIVGRLCTFPPFFYVVWVQRGEVHLLWPISQVLLAVFPALLTCLNVFWFYKIVKGAMKLFLKKEHPLEKKD